MAEFEKDFFLPDEAIGSSLLYRLIDLLFYKILGPFYALEVVGLEKLPPKGTGGLLVSMHTTHCKDIYTFGSMFFAKTGRAIRAMMHRGVYNCLPVTKRVGMLPGGRAVGAELCRKGFMVGCFPGGAREALTGHENAYALQWGKRQGFAHVAKDGGVKVYPFFARNGEEMRFNPLFWLLNVLRMGKVRDAVVKAVPIMDTVFAWLWIPLCELGIPIPVKVTYIFGDPVETDGKSAEEIALATKEALQKLIDDNQPQGHAYLPGLKARFSQSAAVKLD